MSEQVLPRRGQVQILALVSRSMVRYREEEVCMSFALGTISLSRPAKVHPFLVKNVRSKAL